MASSLRCFEKHPSAQNLEPPHTHARPTPLSSFLFSQITEAALQPPNLPPDPIIKRTLVWGFAHNLASLHGTNAELTAKQAPSFCEIGLTATTCVCAGVCALIRSNTLAPFARRTHSRLTSQRCSVCARFSRRLTHTDMYNRMNNLLSWGLRVLRTEEACQQRFHFKFVLSLVSASHQHI